MSPPEARPRGRLLAPVVAALASLAVVVGLTWPLPLHLGSAIPEGYFHGGHVWVLDHVARVLAGAAPWDTATARLGVPGAVELRPLALAPALGAALVRPLLGPVGAYTAVVLLSFPAAALAGHALLRALGCAPWPAAAGALTWAVCPFALGALSSGQLAKFQHWTLALLLLAWVGAARGRVGWALAALPAALALAFTAPSLALWAPLAGALLLVSVGREQLQQGKVPALKGALGLAVALGLTAAVLVFARGWYEPRLPLADQAFIPAVRLAGGRVGELAPVATIENLLWAPTPPTRVDWRTVSHVASLGLPGLAFGLSLGLRGRRRLAGLGVLLLGALLALGPVLTTEAGPVMVGGRVLSLPAALLDAVGYPTARSGMYYRAALVGSLGVALLLAGGATGLRRGALVAWAVAGLQVADGVRATAFLWPRPVLTVPGLDLAREMAADPAPGAVLALPAKVDDGVGSRHLLTAVVHGRPTTALPRNADRLPRTAENLGVVAEAVALGGAAGQARLREAGFRYLSWLDGVRALEGEPDPAALDALLGAPRRRQGLRVWTVP